MQLPKQAYVVAVDMGYGHQRAVFPLIDIATTPPSFNCKLPQIISANDYPSIPPRDRFKWNVTRKIYEGVSRFQGFPFLGKKAFHLMSHIQKIPPFYPRRDLSKPTYSLNVIYDLIRGGFGKHLIDRLSEDPLPLICSFPIPAFAAEEHGYLGDIYCLCTDTDIARAWAPLEPSKSRIIYLAPTERTRERLKLYGVRSDNIIASGFPLPKEAIGDPQTDDVMLASLSRRLLKLDPRGVYSKKFRRLMYIYLNSKTDTAQSDKPLTITYCIGGAGAQSDIGVQILESFKQSIIDDQIRLNLVVGTSESLRNKFNRAIDGLSLEPYLNKNIRVIYNPDKFEYFKEFNALLPETDILWTKPSELSFYVGLGLPIIMAPALGSQEEYNQSWLHMMGAGFEQYDPRYAHEWVFDWINSGWLAEAAMNGFLNASKHGADHIEDIVLHGKRTEIADVHFV